MIKKITIDIEDDDIRLIVLEALAEALRENQALKRKLKKAKEQND